jgi:hypothetical protein
LGLFEKLLELAAQVLELDRQLVHHVSSICAPSGSLSSVRGQRIAAT